MTFTKGSTPWNKGKTNIYSKEVLESNRQKHKGWKHSEESKEKIRLKMKQRRLSPEHKLRIGLAQKGRNQGKSFIEIHGLIGAMELKSKISSNNWARKMKGNFPESTLQKKSGLMSGENNPMFGLRGEKSHAWRGGLNLLPYDKKFTRWFKQEIRTRDNWCCFKCGMWNPDHKKLFKNQSLQIHHINYEKTLTCEENCCALCCRCNAEVNFNREAWTKFFQAKMSERFGYKYTEDGQIIFQITKQENKEQ